MSSFRTEISIPVNRDSRTLEERRQKAFDALEGKYSNQNVMDHSRVVNNERQSVHNKISRDPFFDRDRFFKTDFDNWDTDVSEWIHNSRRRWNDEMERVKRSMFSLETDRDEFDFNSWDPFRSHKRFEDFNRDSEYQRQHILKSNTEGLQASREPKSPIYKSSPISYKTDDKSTSLTKNDSIHNFYEFDPEGQLHFKIRFEAKNFKPEDIKVTCKENNLNIVVQRSDDPGVELHKSIVVPKSVNSQQFQCHITQDGILILEAPVKSPEYESVVSQDSLYANNYKSETHERNHGLVVRNSSGPIVLNDERGKRLHLEIPVDNEYLPGDFSVTTEMNKISVKGRHEFKSVNSSSFKEFSQCYEIPESIDPMSVNFSLIDGMLIIEALVQ